MKAIILLFLLPLLLPAKCMRDFRLGHSKGGNLGLPQDQDLLDLPPAQWFEQKLDHSTPTDLRKWKQRYFVNDSFFDFDNPGPVFLMIGGEGPADPRWMVMGAWIEYAKRFRALCINLEHRYYGKSRPTPDLTVKNLQFLSSYQALADIANFISAINEKHRFKNVKWVAFGGSYPGSLAAWVRVKYPHLVYAAVSSSGPLLAKLDFKEYFEVVVDALREKTGSEDCVDQVKSAHKQLVKMMTTNPKVVEDDFKVCTPFSKASPEDMKNFFNSIADDFADVVQYNEDNRFSANPKYKNLTINTVKFNNIHPVLELKHYFVRLSPIKVCNILNEPGSVPAFKKLAKFNAIILEKSNQTCMDYSYTNMITDLRNISWEAEGGRQWMYQTCTEFGFYQTSSGEPTVFGDYFDLDFFVKQCQDVFGRKFGSTFISNAAEWTNSNYGALDISVSRVVFVHGSIDPWHALGITKSINEDAPAIFIRGTAHCANMYPPSDEDSSDLVMARSEIEKYLSKWISSPK